MPLPGPNGEKVHAQTGFTQARSAMDEIIALRYESTLENLVKPRYPRRKSLVLFAGRM